MENKSTCHMTNEKRLDLIDRQALGIGRCNPDAFPLQNRGYVAGWNGVISLLEQAPRVDAVEVVHGRWIAADYKPYIYCKCSVCGRRITIGEKSNYCSNCGAKMDGGNEDG